MRRLQARRLRRFLAGQVQSFSAYYRAAWADAGVDPRAIRKVSDLARLPFTTKQDLAENPRDFVLAPSAETILRLGPARLARLLGRRLVGGAGAIRRALQAEYAPTSVFFTTGRTAGPTPVLLAPRDEANLLTSGGRIADVLRLDPAAERGLNLFPCAPHLAFWQVVACGRARGLMTLHTGGGRAMGTDGILRLLERMKPSFIVGVPGYTLHLLREAKARMDLDFVRMVATGGDVQTAGVRGRIQELIPSDARVATVYGFTEARICWAECASGTGFHTYPDLGVFEVVDPETGEPLPPETTGELVYTGLGGRGSALVRYRTGDIARGGITYAPCPQCGRTAPRIGSTLTRKADGLVKIKGTLVDLTVLADTVSSDPRVKEWRAEITEGGGLEIYAAMPDGACDSLARRIRVATEVKPDAIHVVTFDEIVKQLGLETQMKETRVLDRRRQASEARR